MGVYCPESSVALCHIPKAAGWSVKQVLAEALPDLHVPNAASYRERGWSVTVDPDLPKGHLALRDWEQYTGTDPRGFDLMLAVVRDPYEREASQWLYWRDLFFKQRRAGAKPMPQHEGAADYVWGVTRTKPEAFVAWLRDPRSQYHVSYNYHDHRPRPKPTGETYADHGGFYRYWLEVDGAVPDNVEVLRLENLDETLPDLLRRYTDEVPDMVPRNNEGPGGDYEKLLTPEACELIEERYPVLTREKWYGRREH